MIVNDDLSRHQFCQANLDDADRLYLEDRKPFRYQLFPDTLSHGVKEGHTLFNLAGRYYKQLDRAAGLWWVIADFQPVPIHDPTIRLVPGSLLFIPSLRVVLTVIFAESRRNETDI